MSIDRDQLNQTLAQLREPFPPDAHVERALPGGGKWFYVPWQQIRERIESICPDYEFEFFEPTFIDAYCSVRCKMVICGVSRIAIGNAEINLKGGRGNAIERAVADAYKNAAEAFGVCAYLDDQSTDKRNAFISYMHKKGDGRALKAGADNGFVKSNLSKSPNAVRPSPPPATQSGVITEAQAKRFFTIGKTAGYTNHGLKQLCIASGFESSKNITRSAYDALCKAAEDSTLAEQWNNFQLEMGAIAPPLADQFRQAIRSAQDLTALETTAMQIRLNQETLSRPIADQLMIEVDRRKRQLQEIAA